jgi:transposase
MKASVITKMSSKEIEQLFKEKDDYQIGMRLAVIYLISKGSTSRDVASDFPIVKHVTVCDWVKRFNQDGLAGLMPKSPPGKPSKASNEQLLTLKDIILNKGPEEFGYNTSTWTGPLLIDWIRVNLGVEIKKASIYVWLKNRLGLRHLKGKGFFPEASQEERGPKVEQLKKTLRS